jgi:hypothetical protein
MAATYWHQHPRGFANECNLVRAETDDQADDLADRGYEQLTRGALRQHVRWLNDENDAWGSNRAFGRISVQAVLSSPEYSVAYRGY